MPMLIGYNSGEALFWARDLPTTRDTYRAYVAGWFASDQIDAVLARYPAASDAEVPKAVAQMVTDFKIATPTAQIARGVSAAAPVYAYRFSRVSPASRASFGGAAHSLEVPYVFDVLPADPALYEEKDRMLSKEMADAWVRFVKFGDPNGKGLPNWPIHRGPDYRLLEFGDTIRVDAIASNPGIAFFESRPAN
jgi:para-nitrobenzyl esterase